MAMVEQVDSKAVDGGLAKVLELAKVHADLIKLFKEEEGVENLVEFSSFFTKDGYEEEAVTFRNKVDSLKTRQIEVSRLRTAILLARAVIDRPTRAPESNGVAIDMEAPLDPEDKESMAKAWTARYGVRLSMWLDPADPLVNRLYREFRRNTPSLIPVTRIRSVYTDNNPHPEKRVMLSGGLSLTVQGEDQVEVVRDVSQYYFALRILANASAKAGNYEFDSKVEKNTKVIFAPLDINQEYADHAFRMALKQPGNSWATLKWLEERDQHTRGLMCNHMKAGFPQGEALEKAIKETELRWSSPAQSQSSAPPRLGGKGGGKAPKVPKIKKTPFGKTQLKTMGKGAGGKGGGVSYASMLKGGKKICRAFNAGNCTDEPCPYGGLHVCSVFQNGRACGGKHPANRHSFGGQGR